ncbi:MAG: dienelactone hydrolase family protein [Candidatus Hydrogenedentes bacterium]|nr:dienelactone hydrolase family protein [Candidatus Hydrogenedentota bacterium]
MLNRREFIAATASLLSLAPFSARADNAVCREVPWLAEVQRPPANPKLTDTGYLEPLLASDDGSPITSLEQWQARRDQIRKRWQDILGPMPYRPAIKLTTVTEDHPAGCRRIRVRYECETGVEVEGFLLYPDPLESAPRPALVVLHSTTEDTIEEVAGVKGRDDQALGLKFAQQGFIVFCPQCFLWNEPSLEYTDAVAKFQQRHPKTLGMRKMLNDAQCAVDILAGLPEVDPKRIGAVGHSLGAKETLYLAAFDERIKAAVFSEGGIGLGFTNWHDPWYLGRGIHDSAFKLNHHQLLALIAPRAFLILAGESGPPNQSVADGARTWPFVEAALPVYKLYGEPARIGLYNHGKGHSIPPEAFTRMSEWLQTYLA